MINEITATTKQTLHPKGVAPNDIKIKAMANWDIRIDNDNLILIDMKFPDLKSINTHCLVYRQQIPRLKLKFQQA
jgi:hypothetical protein